MSTQPEQVLENQLVAKLQTLGYAMVHIRDEKELIANLKKQIEKHNNITFSDKEFDRVLNETHKILMVLRPYQYYAVEALIDRVKNSKKNGYIWHTTGSGKTLTSFKASQVIMNMPEVKKVVFVVDRKDLDYQTTKEFNSFNRKLYFFIKSLQFTVFSMTSR